VLDVALRNLTFRHREGFALRVDDLLFPKSTHTAVVGPPGCGASTLLALIAGELRPDAGDVIIGARPVTKLKAARRPILAVTPALDVPQRWSVQHALVAAVRTRSLDRIDRHREYELVVSKWDVLPERRISTLSSSERTRVHLARIELLRPAILVADRLLEHAPHLADDFYRTMRIHGTTVISAPASRIELAMTDTIVVLDDGRVVQSGNAAAVFAHPIDEAAAIATGDVNVVPVTIRGTVVESVIGAWDVAEPPFQGSGVALARPHDFEVAKAGEDSDFVFGIEEAGFSEGRWLARGMLTGGVTLRVALPAGANVHKGRLMALRYDPSRFTLVAKNLAALQPTIPTDVVPLLRDSR
jgi:putative spermidine/putrescine transport system ATP-binding protein